MNKYDPDRPFLDDDACETFIAVEPKIARRYGRTVRARELANMEYKFRYQKLSSERNMKDPPSTGRIFTGYLVVRKVGTPEQYETWMPDHVFHELYSSDGKQSEPVLEQVIPSSGDS